MEHVEKAINSYLSKQTQYCFLLSGAWGKGKTYFYKHVLEQQIKATSTFKDQSKKYHAVYVSLFGLDSVEKMKSQIAHDLFYSRAVPKSFLGKKSFGLSTRLAKLVITDLLEKYFFKNAKEYLNVITEEKKATISTDDLCVCFDDLERKSTLLEIEDFAGYVNMLTEENVKVLLICSEDKLKDVAKNYAFLKEKIVGITLQYDPSPEHIIEQIITNRYQGNPVYRDFLRSIGEQIIDVSERNLHNYRVLIYALDTLHDVYSILRNEVIDLKKDYWEKLTDELPSLAKFIMATAIDFQKTLLSAKDAEAMKSMNWQIMLRLEQYRDQSGITKIESDVSKLFSDKYYDENEPYLFFDSVFGFITGAKEFIFRDFEDEFKHKYHLSAGHVEPHYEVFNILSNWNVHELSEELYRAETLRLIEFAKEGKYTLLEYLTVYYYASRFDNLLELDLDVFTSELMDAMTKVGNDTQRMENDGGALMQWESMKHEGGALNQEKLCLHGMELVKAHVEKRAAVEMEKLTITFEEDLDNLYERFHSDENFKRNILNYPILSKVDQNKFFAQILSGKPNAVWMVKSILKDRYGYTVLYEQEEELILNLIKFLRLHLDQNMQKTKRLWELKEFYNVLVKLQTEQERLKDERISHT